MRLLLLWALLLPLNASAVTYFISSSQGTDSGPGTSSGAPWRTFQYAQSNGNWSPGNSFLFRCGDTWRFDGAKFETQGNGSSGNPITIGSYGPCAPTEPNHRNRNYPIFTRTKQANSGWTSAGTNLWQKGASDEIRDAGPNWFFNNLRAAWIEEHSVSGCPGSMTEDYEVCYKHNSDSSVNEYRTVYIRVPAGFNPNSPGSPGIEYLVRPSSSLIRITNRWINLQRIAIWKVGNCISVDDNSDLDIIFDDITCEEMGWKTSLHETTVTGKRGSWAITVNVGSSRQVNGDFTLKNSRIINSGRDAIDIGPGMPDGDITILNNVIVGGYDHGAMYLGFNAGDTTPKGRAEGTWLIQNNDVSGVCGGIGFGEGSSKSGSFANLRFVGNYIHDLVKKADILAGNSKSNGGRLKMRSGIDKVPDCSDAIRGITTTGNGGDGGPMGVYMYRNIVVGVPEYGIFMNRGDASPFNVEIYHNTIIDSGVAAISIERGSGSVKVYNNALSKNGGATDKTLFVCRVPDGKVEQCNLIDLQNNYFDVANTSNHAFTWGGTNYTLSQAKTSIPTPVDANNKGNLSTDTTASNNLFVNRSSRNYIPGSNSGLLNSGKTISGVAFNGSAPDIGALEAGETTDTNTDTGTSTDTNTDTQVDPPVLKLGGCAVNATAANKITCEFDAGTPPMLPATFCDAGWMLTGAEACIIGCTRTASEQFTFTLDQNVHHDEVPVLHYSKAVGNTTNSASVELEDVSNFPVTNSSDTSLVNAANVSASVGPFALGRDPSNLFDGDVLLQSGTTGNVNISSFSVTNDLGELFIIGLTRLYGDAEGGWQCNTYGIEYSQNCTDYTTFGSNFTCNANTYFSQNLNQIARCLRLTVQGPASGTQAREWQAFKGTTVDGGNTSTMTDTDTDTDTGIPELRVIIGTSATGVNVK